MRTWLIGVALWAVSQEACAQSADDAMSRLKACFRLDRALQAECLEQLSQEVDDKKHNQDTRSWIVTETLSPVDYSPMITATTSSQRVQKDGPSTFTIRCRAGRTDLLVSTEGAWRASRENELQVDLKVNDQPASRMQWVASPDGRSALFKEDAIQFLRSLPDEGLIKIGVSDWQGAAHEALFHLTGLETIRRKIAAVCKWTPAPEKMAPARR